MGAILGGLDKKLMGAGKKGRRLRAASTLRVVVDRWDGCNIHKESLRTVSHNVALDLRDGCKVQRKTRRICSHRLAVDRCDRCTLHKVS